MANDTNVLISIRSLLEEQNKLLRLQTTMQWQLAQIPLGLEQKQSGTVHYGLYLQRYVQAYQLHAAGALNEDLMATVVADAIEAFSLPKHGQKFAETWQRVRSFYSAEEQSFITELFNFARSTESQ